jgi:HK97 family phage portal protein
MSERPWETFVADAAPPPAESRAITGEELLWPGTAGSAGVMVTERTSLQLAAVLAVVNVVSSDVAALPLRVHRRNADGSEVLLADDPRDDLLNVSPDQETTAIAFRQALMAHALLYGNGYAEIVRRGRGVPASLHLLSPETTRTERDPATRSLKYCLPSGKSLPPENVFHLSGLSFDGLNGFSMVRLLRQAIGVALAAEGFTADYYANGSEPGGVIEVPQRLNGEAAKNLRESWEAKHRGYGSRHRVAILEQGAKFSGTASDPEKAQLLESRKYQVVDIARAWRIPPHKVGDYSQAHLANIEASNQDYITTALMFWLVAWEQQALLKLFSAAERKAGYYVEHHVDALLRGDITSRYNAYGQALDKGWMSRDEVRRKESLNPIGEDGGGTKYLVQLNQTTLERIGEDETTEPAAEAMTEELAGEEPEAGEDLLDEETEPDDGTSDDDAGEAPDEALAARSRKHRAARTYRRYNDAHDEHSRFAESDGGGGSEAAGSYDGSGGGHDASAAADQIVSGHDASKLDAEGKQEVAAFQADAASQLNDLAADHAETLREVERTQKAELKEFDRDQAAELKDLERGQKSDLKDFDRDQRGDVKEHDAEAQAASESLLEDEPDAQQLADHDDAAAAARVEFLAAQGAARVEFVAAQANEHSDHAESQKADREQFVAGQKDDRDGQLDTNRQEYSDLVDSLTADFAELYAELTSD